MKDTLSKNRIFEVLNESYENTNGNTVNNYYVLDIKNWVQVVVSLGNNKLLLIKQYRHAGKSEFYEFPGGVVEEGESFELAARRELLEEVGIEVGELKNLGEYFPNPALQNNKVVTFLAEEVLTEVEQNLDENEEIQVLSLTKSEIDKKISHSPPHALMLASYFLYLRYKSK